MNTKEEATFTNLMSRLTPDEFPHFQPVFTISGAIALVPVNAKLMTSSAVHEQPEETGGAIK